jgi:hypothetical protein
MNYRFNMNGMNSCDKCTGNFLSAAMSCMYLWPNVPAEVAGTESGSPPGMAAASSRAESVASCGFLVLVYQN